MRRALIVSTGRTGPDSCSVGWRQAFTAGLRVRGWQVDGSDDHAPCDLMVIWGVRRRDLIARQKASGGEVCILERGYLGDRFAWTSVSFGGGLNGWGEFRAASDDASRFQKHFGHLMQPWRTADESYALLIGQVPGDMSIEHANIFDWYRCTYAHFSRSGRDVRFRPHPLAGRFGQDPAGMKQIGGSLAEALAGASVCITFNSNAGVEAALAGVPIITCDRGAMAWPVAGHTLDEIVTPERTEWAARLAWCQWTKAEMASGECMEAIGL